MSLKRPIPISENEDYIYIYPFYRYMPKKHPKLTRSVINTKLPEIWENEKLAKNPPEKQNNVDFYIKYKGTYKGEWREDKREGKGKMTDNKGNVFDGNWKDDKFLDGRVKISYGRDDYTGYGPYIYEGEWNNDIKEGTGKMTYPTGEVYDGEWNGDKREGTGKLTYPNGKVYAGEWANDMRNGTGKLIDTSGEVEYDGQWNKDKREGKGKETYGDLEYDGNWIKDKREGYGVQKYQNGEVYEGEWKINMREGKGTLKDKNGNITHTGKWENDRFTEDLRPWYSQEFGGGKTSKRTRKHRKHRKTRKTRKAKN